MHCSILLEQRVSFYSYTILKFNMRSLVVSAVFIEREQIGCGTYFTYLNKNFQQTQGLDGERK